MFSASSTQQPNLNSFDAILVNLSILCKSVIWLVIKISLIPALTKISAPYPRLAQFRCTLVLAWPDGHDEIFEGTVAGQVVWPPRGLDGHGYDPIFQPNGYEITCGEMSFENKNKISHRSIAFDKLVRACFE